MELVGLGSDARCAPVAVDLGEDKDATPRDAVALGGGSRGASVGFHPPWASGAGPVF